MADQDGDGTAEDLVRCLFRSAMSSDAVGDSPASCERIGVRLSATGKIGPPWIMEFCRGPHGARGIGEDSVEVEAGQVVHRRVGGSAWMWTDTCAVGLNPLRRAYRHATSEWLNQPDVTAEERIDYVRSRVRVSYSSARCDGDAAKGPVKGRWFVIPTVHGAPASADESAGTERWFDGVPCPLELDASESGIAAKGQPGGPADSRMRVAAWDDEDALRIRLEVHDDVAQPRAGEPPPSTKWLAVDHAELWLSPRSPALLADCSPSPKRDIAHQWALHPAPDGAWVVEQTRGKSGWPVEGWARWNRASKTEAGADGAPGPAVLSVQWTLRGEARQAARLGSLSVIYSDGDDGRTQKALLSTSGLRFADATSFGRLGPPICLQPDARFAPGPPLTPPLAQRKAPPPPTGCEPQP